MEKKEILHKDLYTMSDRDKTVDIRKGKWQNEMLKEKLHEIKLNKYTIISMV